MTARPTPHRKSDRGAAADALALPAIEGGADAELRRLLRERRSLRHFAEGSVTRGEVSRLLWAAQGITGECGRRTAPSAGARFPLEVHVVAGSVEGLAPGLYRYRARDHSLLPVVEGDRRRELCIAAYWQEWVERAALLLALSAVSERTTAKYGIRGFRYVHMEAGHAAQNVYLEAAALGLGVTVVGSFRDEEMKRLLQLAPGEDPLYLMPVGRPV
jgi:SagB-type dehydrogenase family enzyme